MLGEKKKNPKVKYFIKIQWKRNKKYLLVSAQKRIENHQHYYLWLDTYINPKIIHFDALNVLIYFNYVLWNFFVIFKSFWTNKNYIVLLFVQFLGGGPGGAQNFFLRAYAHKSGPPPEILVWSAPGLNFIVYWTLEGNSDYVCSTN